MFLFINRSNNPLVLGQDNANLPKIFLIIAEGVANESIKVEDDCSKRLANVIRQVQVSLVHATYGARSILDRLHPYTFLFRF